MFRLILTALLGCSLLCSMAPISRPAAPANTRAGAWTASEVTVTWADNSPNEDGFIVEFSTDGKVFVEKGRAGEHATSYRVRGLTGNTAYSFRVRAYNGAGWSDPSNVASGRTKP